MSQLLRGTVPSWAEAGDGDGYGYGDGNSYGHGYGDGNGSGHGYGYGYGSGDGSGEECAKAYGSDLTYVRFVRANFSEDRQAFEIARYAALSPDEREAQMAFDSLCPRISG